MPQMKPLLWTVTLAMLMFLLNNLLNNFSANQKNMMNSKSFMKKECPMVW